MSNRQYDFTLAAVLGASQRIDATGAKLKVLASPAGPVGVKIDGGPEISLMEGQGFNMAPGKTFRDVVVRNLQATANTGSIFIGDEGFEDTRITGNVKVIDQSADQTSAGAQFIAVNGVSNGALGVVAGIWAQSKPCIIRSLMFGSSLAVSMEIVRGTGRPLTNQGAASAPANKMVNGASAVSALPVSGTVAGAFPVLVGDLAGVQAVGYVTVQAGGLMPLSLKTPIIIPTGGFFGFATAVANAAVQFIAEIEE